MAWRLIRNKTWELHRVGSLHDDCKARIINRSAENGCLARSYAGRVQARQDRRGVEAWGGRCLVRRMECILDRRPLWGRSGTGSRRLLEVRATATMQTMTIVSDITGR